MTSASIAALADALRSLALSGPLSLTPIERRFALAGWAELPLPNRASAAFDDFIRTGSASALMDLVAWSESIASRSASFASTSLTLEPLVPAIPGDSRNAAVEDLPFERWIDLIVCGQPDRAKRASALLASSNEQWLDAMFEALERAPDELSRATAWLEPLFASLTPRAPLSDRLLTWLERSPRASWSPALVAALARSDYANTERFERAIDGVPTGAWCSTVLATVLDRAPERAVRLAFAWLEAGVALDRAVHARALDAAVLRFEPEFASLAAARLNQGPFAWEVEKLERISRSSRRR